ncbi:NTP transferase domain-containing protein [Rubritalea spongiae]|uniref:Probable molybdenum cofactor guanylyltransferase n=1 Tax=Rubritalea spongiae TaxID=430797 RepID=A0ABW5E209_9BACT
MPAPLYGLLLVGGKSTRMGQDKAQLIYRDDTPEWQRLYAHLEALTEQAFLCHRADQDFGVPAIIDPAEGPLCAIHAAQQAHPNARWLVIACDLPLLEGDTLSQLIESANPEKDATSFASNVDHRAEPLCAIYEPSSAAAISTAVSDGKRCPRHLLEAINTALIPLAKPFALNNANSPADTLEIRSHLTHSREMKSITIRYFAQLRELAKCDTEEVTTESVTPSGLYEELKSRHNFPHKQKQLMVAINDDFADWATPLKPGDEVVFIPPVAGG